MDTRSLEGCSPWGPKELDRTEPLSTHTSTNVSHRWVGLAGSAAGSIHGRASLSGKKRKSSQEKQAGHRTTPTFFSKTKGKGTIWVPNLAILTFPRAVSEKPTSCTLPSVFNPSPQISWLPKISRCFSFYYFSLAVLVRNFLKSVFNTVLVNYIRILLFSIYFVIEIRGWERKGMCQKWDSNPRLHTETRIPNVGKLRLSLAP